MSESLPYNRCFIYYSRECLCDSTGATGFVAGHILHSLLKAGFKVKATVHSKEKADRLIELYPSWKDDLQVVVVEDIARDGSFDEAVKGVTGVRTHPDIWFRLKTMF